MNKYKNDWTHNATHQLGVTITSFLSRLILFATTAPLAFCAHEIEIHRHTANQACRAIRANQERRLAQLMQKNPFLVNNYEIFHLAVALAKPKMVKQLLSLGFEATCTDKNGRTALHALCNPHLVYTQDTIDTLAELVNLLIEKGADIDGTEKSRSPLFHALRNRQSELVEIFLAHQPHLCTTKRRIASHLAVSKNDLDSLKHILFLDPGLVNMQDHAGHSILDIAVINNLEEIIRYLLSRQDLEFDTLLWAFYYAVDASKVSGATLKHLLQKLSIHDPNVLNYMFRHRKFHGTALHKAAYRRNIEHVKTLLSCGIEVICPNDNDALAIHAVAENKATDNTQEIAGLLLETEPGSINWRTKGKQTALSLATQKGNERLALFLLARGAVTNRAAGGRERLYRNAAAQQLQTLMKTLR